MTPRKEELVSLDADGVDWSEDGTLIGSNAIFLALRMGALGYAP